LGLGVRTVVLGKIFPLDQLEVVPKSLDLAVGPLSLGGGAVIDQAKVEKLAAIEGVEVVFPKMRLTVPSLGIGGKEVLGTDLRSEMVADGIEPDLVEKDIGRDHPFRDFDDPQGPEYTAPQACEADADCGEDLYCGMPSGYQEARLNKDKAQGADKPAKVCRHYIPVIASEHVVELYNGALRRAHGFPKLNPDFVIGIKFDLKIGASMVGASAKDTIIREKGMLVGFSRKAITLGITMPIGYTKRFNVAFGKPQDAQRYHSAILMVPEKDDVAAVAMAVEGLNLEVADTGAEQAALLIAIFIAVFSLVSAVIVGIAAVNIMHVFFMLVYERQHEIGIMRAVGASRGDITAIILGEAAVLGVLAGVAGVLMALGAAEFFDMLSTNYIPDFPYKPTSYFIFPWWLIASSLGFSVSFCVFGAFLPARRAARMQPAMVLSGH
ncbi:MAG: FtsX-like permease family protein, partial [Nannocystaceae bacterium]|nr:FtsX-like permease family protein [Nannocystaceae bacterium]